MQESKFYQRKIAVIIGTGDLPEQVILGLEKLNITFSVIIFNDITTFHRKNIKVIDAKFENIDELFIELETNKFTSIICCGYVPRPQLDLSKMSSASKLILEPIIKNFKLGDEAVFRSILSLFDGKGIKPLSIKEIIPELFPVEEFLTDRKPNLTDCEDAKRAKEIFEAISSADLGQSLVVKEGLCIGVETSLGTDHMLDSLSQNKQQDVDNYQTGGVLYKAPKIGQNPFLDLPVIGKKTIIGLQKSGLNGIAIERFNVIVLMPKETIQLANDLGVFIWCRR